MSGKKNVQPESVNLAPQIPDVDLSIGKENKWTATGSKQQNQKGNWHLDSSCTFYIDSKMDLFDDLVLKITHKLLVLPI